LARAAALAVSAAIVLALGIATVVRNRTWSEPLSLWTDVTAKSPRDARAHFNLGVALGDLGRFDEAIFHHETSLRIDAGNAKAHNGLGVALAGQGRYLDAVRHFAASVRIDPADPEARANLKLAVERMQSGARPPPAGAESP
jgi:Flp pilus assembly protein TadD